MKQVILLIGVFIVGIANAWFPNAEMSKVVEVISYEEAVPVLIVKLQSGNYCYVETTNKVAVAAILMMKATDKTAQWHCHDTTEAKYGYPAHKLHRYVIQ